MNHPRNYLTLLPLLFQASIRIFISFLVPWSLSQQQAKVMALPIQAVTHLLSHWTVKNSLQLCSTLCSGLDSLKLSAVFFSVSNCLCSLVLSQQSPTVLAVWYCQDSLQLSWQSGLVRTVCNCNCLKRPLFTVSPLFCFSSCITQALLCPVWVFLTKKKKIKKKSQ